MFQKENNNERRKNIDKILLDVSSQMIMSDKTNDMIDRWFVGNEADAEVNDAMIALFVAYDVPHKTPSKECLKSLAQTKCRLGISAPAPKVMLHRRVYGRVAAVAAGLLLLGMTLSRVDWNKPMEVSNVIIPTAAEVRAAHIADIENGPHQVIATIEGVQKDALLPDSTHVWVNSGSKLSTPKTFKGERRVFLEGEACFEIKSNNKPFYVHTQDLDVKALGTTFNVNDCADEQKTVVTLLKGSVEVTSGGEIRRMIPGERLLFYHPTNQMVVETIDMQVLRINDWRSKTISVHMKTVPEILQMIANYYDTRIVFDTNDFSSNRYSVDFNKDETVETVVAALANVSESFKFEQQNDAIVIRSIKQSQQ